VGIFRLEIPGGTRIMGTGGIPPSRIDITIAGIPIMIPYDTFLLTPIYQLAGYDAKGNSIQIQYDPPVRLTIRYDPEKLPENSYPPYIARYSDEEGLVPLESPVRFPTSIGRVDGLVDISGLFVAVAEEAPIPPPLPIGFTASNLIISPHEAFEGDPVRVSITITNGGSEEGTYELYLIIDGIVRAIQEVALSGKSSETLTFEIANLAAGTHQIKAAGLTETIRIEQAAFGRLGPGVNWMVFDLSVGGVIIIGLIAWLLYMLRARRRAAGVI
jgi:hypothetical protein